MKPVGEPDAGNPHVRFDERGWETERCHTAQATAPILDSTFASFRCAAEFGRYRGLADMAGTTAGLVPVENDPTQTSARDLAPMNRGSY
jgi:hypothetical protein